MFRLFGIVLFAYSYVTPWHSTAQGEDQDPGQDLCTCLNESDFIQATLADRRVIFTQCMAQLAPANETRQGVDATANPSSITNGDIFAITKTGCPEMEVALRTVLPSGYHGLSPSISIIDAETLLSEAINWIEKGFNEEQAIQQLSTIIQSYPHHPEAWYQRGLAKLATGDFYGAIGDFFGAIEFGPHIELYRQGIGYAKVKIGDYNSAIPDLRYTQKALPESVEVVNELGMAYYQVERLDSAIFYFKKSVSLDPQNYSNNYNLMYTLAFSGRKNEAMDIVEAAMARFDTISHGYELRAELYFLLEDYREAYSDYTLALNAGSNHRKEILQSMGICSYELEEFPSALDTYNLLIEEYDNLSSDIYLNRGRILTQLGEHKTAIQDFNTAIDLNTEDANGYYRRGQSYLALNNWKRAERDFDRALSMAPYYMQAYYERGQARLGRGDINGACQDFEVANEYERIPGAAEAISKHCKDQ
ncbi:MAG: tetratricopeptide repeat protein [Bacteroidota bacterium]